MEQTLGVVEKNLGRVEKTSSKMNKTLERYHRALTIKEKVDILRKNKIYNYNYEDLHKWINVRGVVNEDNIYEMIHSYNMSVDKFNNGFKKLTTTEELILEKEVCKSEWYKFYLDSVENFFLEESKINELQDLDLNYTMLPFTRKAKNEIEKSIKKLKNIKVENKAIIKIIEKILAVGINCGIKTFIWELNKFVEKNRVPSEQEDNKVYFNKFIKNTFLGKDDFKEFYSEHPVILRIMIIKIQQIIENFNFIFQEIDFNYKEISNIFNINYKENAIIDIHCNEGDTHQQGNFVIKLDFKDGSIIYKPRNLKIYGKFYEFIDLLNKEGGEFNIYRQKRFYSEKYTLEEYVKYESCNSEEEIIEYFKNFAQICTLIYILRGNDIHYENIIAHGKYPVIVDLETLFQHQLDVLDSKESSFYKAYKECIHSIAGTALIPIVTFSKGENGRGIDISALNGKSQKLPYKVLGITNVNTNNMRFEYKEVELKDAKNIPMLLEKRVDFKGYVDIILKEFERTMKFLMKNKEKIIGKEGYINVFKDIIVRHLLKATQSYAKMMDFSSHPNYSKEMSNLERMFANIWSYNYKNKIVIKSEFEDMLFSDIPIFFGKTDSRDLINSRGEVIHNYFDESSFSKVVNRIENLSSREIDKQIAQILISLGLYLDINKKSFEKRKSISNCEKIMDVFNKERDILLKEAIVIADRIMEEAIEDELYNTVTWNNVAYDEINECWKVRPLDEGIASGISGLLIFFSSINTLARKPEYEALILKMINSLEDIPNIQLKDSLYEGEISILYSLSQVYSNLKNNYVYEKIYKLAKKIMKEIEDNDINITVDLKQIMLNIYEYKKDVEFLNFAEKLKEGVSSEEKEKEFLDNLDDTLEKGNMRRIDMLLNKFNESSSLKYEKEINKIVSKVILEKRENGDYKYYTIKGYTSVGLFNGLAGIGYEMLRLYNRKNIKSIFNLNY